MASTKISDDAALTGAQLATADLLPVVDVSAGSNKSMTAAQFGIGLATLNAINPYVRRLSMSGHITLTATDAQYQFLDPNGSDRNVTLWVPAAGDAIVVKHIGGANSLAIKHSGGSTLTTLAAGEVGVLIYDGTEWQGM